MPDKKQSSPKKARNKRRDRSVEAVLRGDLEALKSWGKATTIYDIKHQTKFDKLVQSGMIKQGVGVE